MLFDNGRDTNVDASQILTIHLSHMSSVFLITCLSRNFSKRGSRFKIERDRDMIMTGSETCSTKQAFTSAPSSSFISDFISPSLFSSFFSIHFWLSCTIHFYIPLSLFLRPNSDTASNALLAWTWIEWWSEKSEQRLEVLIYWWCLNHKYTQKFFHNTINMQFEFNENLLREQNRTFCISVKISVEKITVNESYQINQCTIASLVKHFNSGTFDRLHSQAIYVSNNHVLRLGTEHSVASR